MNSLGMEHAGIIRILWLDDDQDFLDLCNEYLSKEKDLSIDYMLSPKEAMGKVMSERYDIVISDFSIPDMDGIQFLRALRSLGNDAFFVLFTGKGSEELAIEALDNGADFYLQKAGNPISMFDELTRAVRGLASGETDPHNRLEKLLDSCKMAFKVYNHGNLIVIKNDKERVLATTSRA